MCCSKLSASVPGSGARQRKARRSSPRGFSLVELIVAQVVVSIIAAGWIMKALSPALDAFF